MHTTTAASPRPPSSADPDLIAALRSDLTEARFTNDDVAQLLGPDAVAALDREQIVPGQLRVLELFAQAAGTDVPGPESQAARHPDTQGGIPLSPRAGTDVTARAPGSQLAPCAVLTGLWLLAVDVTADQVEAALPAVGVEGLRELGLVWTEATGEGVFCRPAVDLRPYQSERNGSQGFADLWVASDLSAHQVDGPLPADHVLGIGQASLTLASITHRKPVRTALDIGTGCGIQLFHLLDHAEHVTGTDLSERALAFARFNLLLNAPQLGLDPDRLDERVELLHGSLLDPVAGSSFDLVVSNPPFVITPRREQESRYVYRDGGRTGDEVMADLISGMPEVLAAGGTAQMLGNWEVPDGSDWETRPRQWVDGTGLDAWFIQRDHQTPAEYAETWLRDASEERDLATYRSRYADYLQDFESRGVSGIGFGMIWLHRPDSAAADPWRRFEEIAHPVEQPLGPVIGRTAERAAEAAESVLDRALMVPSGGDVTEERYQRFGAAHPEVILARQGSGLRRGRPVSSAAAGFLSAADGEFTAGQLITAVAALLDDGETDVEVLEESLRAEVIDLYIEGYLH